MQSGHSARNSLLDGVTKALVVGAHPDDEMACSGTIARLAAAGVPVSMITFSRCRDAIPLGFTVNDLIDEWMAGHKLLGVHGAELLDLPNKQLPDFRQDVLDRLFVAAQDGYDLVLCPSLQDAHQDHGTVAHEVVRAFKATATILGFELPLNHVAADAPRAFVRLTAAQLDMKVAHVQLYRTQAFRPYMQEAYVRGLAAVRGMQCGSAAAEAYEVIRLIVQ